MLPCSQQRERGTRYLEELRAFVEKYSNRTSKNPKTLEALQQFYSKIQDYENALRVLNELMELCAPSELGRILHYTIGKNAATGL